MTEIADLTPAIRWTNDCQGKKDYDGSIIRVSTRYWPRGGGFWIAGPKGFEDNDRRPEIKPSATAAIVLCYGEIEDGAPDGDYLTLWEASFEADTEGEVKAQVEAWVLERYQHVASALTDSSTREG